MYVLRTGCQWKALPKERFGSASAIHKRFLEWEKAGVFEALWKAGLAEYDQMEGHAFQMRPVMPRIVSRVPTPGHSQMLRADLARASRQSV